MVKPSFSYFLVPCSQLLITRTPNLFNVPWRFEISPYREPTLEPLRNQSQTKSIIFLSKWLKVFLVQLISTKINHSNLIYINHVILARKSFSWVNMCQGPCVHRFQNILNIMNRILKLQSQNKYALVLNT